MKRRTKPIARSTKPIKRKKWLKRNWGKKKTVEEISAGIEGVTTAYFLQGIERSTWICEECGAYIIHRDWWRKLAAQCHILPKAIFKSVAGNLDNRLHLCNMHHDDYDSSWEKASKMKVFTLARERLQLFKHLITEKRDIPDVFL